MLVELPSNIKCVCKKTHLSGKTEIKQNDFVWYKPSLVWNGKMGIPDLFYVYVNYKSVVDNKTYYEEFVYLPNDFSEHFEDISALRDRRIKEIFE